MIGKRFNQLTVVKEVDPYITKHNRKKRYLCLCDCGNEKVVWGTKLRQGRVYSCGCQTSRILSENATKTHTKHGKCGTPIYTAYRNMIERCCSEGRADYDRYKGRGITVCDRWKECFENFYEDMGDSPGKDYSLERIDNDKGYYKENCKWVTLKEQSRNKHWTLYVEYEGENIKLMDLCDKLGINAQFIRSRMNSGWSLEEAIEIPKGVTRKRYYRGDY